MNFNQLNQIKKEVKQEITKIKKNNKNENENQKEDEKINIQFKWSGFKPQTFQYYTINK